MIGGIFLSSQKKYDVPLAPILTRVNSGYCRFFSHTKTQNIPFNNAGLSSCP